MSVTRRGFFGLLGAAAGLLGFGRVGRSQPYSVDGYLSHIHNIPAPTFVPDAGPWGWTRDGRFVSFADAAEAQGEADRLLRLYPGERFRFVCTASGNGPAVSARLQVQYLYGDNRWHEIDPSQVLRA